MNRIKIKDIDWWETTYLIIYAIALIFNIWGTTMFPDIWPSRFGLFLYFVIMIYVFLKGLKKFTYTKAEAIFAFVIGISFLICAFKNDMYSFLFLIAFLIIGAKDVSIDKILKIYLIISVIMLFATFGASMCGWIENLQYWKGYKMRFSFGMIYPTDFATHIFYIMLAAICLFNRKICFVEAIIICAIAGVVFQLTVAYTSFLCMLCVAFCIVLNWFLAKKNVEVKDGITTRLISLAPIVFSTLFIGMAVLYDEKKAKWVAIDNFLSERLQNSKIGLDINGFNLWGKYIEEQGWGRSVIEKEDYFFLDDSYIRIMLEYGIVVLIVVLSMMVVSSRRAAKARRITMVFAIAIVSLHSFMEHHMLEIAYNPFILCVFADLSLDRSKKGCMILNKL